MATDANQNIGISVDRDFARFGSKSYAINKINTVDVRSTNPNKPGGALVCGLISIICVLFFLGDPGFGMLLTAVFFGVLAYALFKNSQIVEHHLFLVTSSSEAQAFTSRDSDQVQTLRMAIERAMVGQEPNF